MSRFSSTGALPNSNYTLITPSLPDTNPHALTNAPSYAQRCLFVAPTGNTGTITIKIGAGIVAVLAANDQYVLESAPQTTFDLAQITATSSNSGASTLSLFVQP